MSKHNLTDTTVIHRGQYKYRKYSHSNIPISHLSPLPRQQPLPLPLHPLNHLARRPITQPKHRHSRHRSQQPKSPRHRIPPKLILNKPTPKRTQEHPHKRGHSLDAERLRHGPSFAEDPRPRALHFLEDLLRFDV